jgi:hypothetical protein
MGNVIGHIVTAIIGLLAIPLFAFLAWSFIQDYPLLAVAIIVILIGSGVVSGMIEYIAAPFVLAKRKLDRGD